MSSNKSAGRRDQGFSLVEVLIAMALLAAVLMGITGLFVLARKNVFSGRQMTQAASAGTQVMEELNTLSKGATLSAFGLLTATTGTSNTVAGQTFPNSFIRTTTNITTTTDPSGFLARWRTEIIDRKQLKDGVITVVFTPTNDSVDPPNNPIPMTTATVVRMRVFVMWNETGRNRQIALDAVKIERN